MPRPNPLSDSLRTLCRHLPLLAGFQGLALVLAFLGTAGVRANLHALLDHSLYADTLLHGLDAGALAEILANPGMGSFGAALAPSFWTGILFALASLVLMPGVFKAYAEPAPLGREAFFRACGRNLGRFVRLALVHLGIACALGGILLGIQEAVVTHVQRTTPEVLPFFLRLGGAAITFVLLSWLRLWFDLARAQVVVRDQGAVRRALAATFRQPFRHPLRLLGAYVFIGLLGLGCLLAGIGVWHALVPPASVAGAFLVGQGTLFLGMACRFWQRALAVRHLDAVREASAPDC